MRISWGELECHLPHKSRRIGWAADDTGLQRDEQRRLPHSKLPSLYDFFSPSGLLSRSGLEFEHRLGQYEMARAIEKAFADKRHLIVEAGTGTGKTLAYLLPALRLARERQQRVIISTGTKNLQEQLFFKDVPFLESSSARSRSVT
jgi:superfamily II DNA or RNA helicase